MPRDLWFAKQAAAARGTTQSRRLGAAGTFRPPATAADLLQDGGVLLGRKNKRDFAVGWRTNGLFRGAESRIDAKSANSANFVKTLAILKELRYNNSTRITCGRDRRLVPAYPL